MIASESPVYNLPAWMAAFEAVRVGSLVAYWDARTLSALADGDTIASVADSSGNGIILAPTASPAGPTKQTVSGNAVMRFDGSQSLSALGLGRYPSLPLSAEITVVILGKPSSSQTSNSTPILMVGNGSSPFRIDINASTASDTPGVPRVSNGTTFSGTSGPSMLDDAWHVLAVTADTTKASVYLDNYMINSQTTANVLATAFEAPIIGRGTSGSGFIGDIGAIMVFSKMLAQPTLAAIATYLNTAWGTGITLGSAISGVHAYETGATADTSTIRIWTPPSPITDAPLVLWSHPQGANEQIGPSYFSYGLVHAALAKGWYFAASSMGYSGSPGTSASSWGNATAQTALSQLYTLMAARRTFNNVILVGASMGALANALAVVQGTIPNVKGIYAIDGVFDLYAMYKTSTYTGTIDSGYSISAGTLSSAASAGATSISSSVSFASGTTIAIDPQGTNPELVTTTGAPSGSGPYTIPVPALGFAHNSGVKVSDYGTKTSGKDPMLASVSNFAGKRTRFLASLGDTTVVKATHSDAFQARISGSATESAIVTHKGIHLGGGAENPADFVAFVERCLGS